MRIGIAHRGPRASATTPRFLRAKHTSFQYSRAGTCELELLIEALARRRRILDFFGRNILASSTRAPAHANWNCSSRLLRIEPADHVGSVHFVKLARIDPLIRVFKCYQLLRSTQAFEVANVHCVRPE